MIKCGDKFTDSDLYRATLFAPEGMAGVYEYFQREQANACARDKIRDLQKGMDEFKCSGGDCCAELWKRTQEIVKTIASIEDPIERNRQINTAYANLYSSHPAGQTWAGTAAFVSKQAGCLMRSNPFSPNETLGEINRNIFSSIYPPLRLIEEGRKRGMSDEEIQACLDGKMQDLQPKGVDKKDFQKLKDGVNLTLRGEANKAAQLIADYEQKTVAQPIWDSSTLLQAGGTLSNTFGFNRDLYLTNECTGPGNLNARFPENLDVTNADHRVRYYLNDYLPRFERLAREGGFDQSMVGIRNRTP